VAICLWPLAWAVCDLVTKFLIDLAVNPSSNAGLGTANAVALVSGPLAGLAYLIVVAIWVIGSTLFAPVFIGILLAAGGATATAAAFGATLGSGANKAALIASGALGGTGGVANLVGATGSNGTGYISPKSASRMNGPAQNYARRPMASQNEKET
jgi:hypothetical protein